MKVVRSTRVSLKDANTGKLAILRSLLAEYTIVCNQYIQLFWVDNIVTRFTTGRYGAGFKATCIT